MMNRSVMGRQMFAKGGAAFPDLSGDGKVTQKDILMGRGVVPMAEGGEVPGDVRAIFQGLVESMRGSKDKVAAYVRENSRDLSDIAKMYPNMAAMINEGFRVTSEVSPARAPMGGLDEDAPGVVRGPDGRVTDYFPPREEPLVEDMQPYQSSEQEMKDFFDNMRRLEEIERPDDPVPVAPVAPPEGVYMQMGGEPMAAAMEQGAVPAEPMAAMGAPSPADLGSMDTAGIASQMDPEVVAIMQGAANSFGDPEQAESLEGMMDAVRGTRATEEERREELAGVVGPEDAAATPDSVLAMVQPLMLLMGAQGAMETEVDTGGIGPMAQDTMNVPVSGDMAGGIMQMAAAPPPPPEGGVPPVNFSQGGEVLRFSEGEVVPGPVQNIMNLKAVPEDMPTFSSPSLSVVAAPELGKFAETYKPKRTLKEAYDARLPVLEQITGGSSNDAAQIQFFSDLAKAGAAFAQPGKPGQSVLSQLASSVAGSGIAENAAKLAASREATEKALKLKAFEGAEKELAAEEATRRASELAQKDIFNQGVSAFTNRSQAVANIKNANEQQVELTKLNSSLNDLRSRLAAGRAYMSQAEILEKTAEINKKQKELDNAFSKNQQERDQQFQIDKLDMVQLYDMDKLTTQLGSAYRMAEEERKLKKLIAENKLAHDKEALKKDQKNKDRLYELKKQETALKKHAAGLKKLKASRDEFKNAATALPAALLKETEVSTGDGTTIKKPFFEVWGSARGEATVSNDNPEAKKIAQLLEYYFTPELVFQDGEMVPKKENVLSPELAQATLNRSKRGNTDVSTRVKNLVELQLLAKDPGAQREKLKQIRKSSISMFEGMGYLYNGANALNGRDLDNDGIISEEEQVKAEASRTRAVSEAAKDAAQAFGLKGFASRAINAGGRAAIGAEITGAADRGAAVIQRVFVDGLTAAMQALPGRENVLIQERLAKVVPGNFLVVSSAQGFYDKAKPYLGSVAAEIQKLEAAVFAPGVTRKASQERLKSLTNLYATYNGMAEFLNVLKTQEGLTER